MMEEEKEKESNYSEITDNVKVDLSEEGNKCI